MLRGDLGSSWGGFGKRNGHGRRPSWVNGATLVGLGLPLVSLRGALWATLGTKKVTMEAPRRVRGLFGAPIGFWQGLGLILGVLLGSKKGHFKGSEP